MPAILREFPNFVYIVLGATHPTLIREQGERYRISLESLAKKAASANAPSVFAEITDDDIDNLFND